ncbi:SRPBCC family protein [Phenylobacterium sp. SCN 70-31]|uniref:SRPBCC family protein n=1 Tax=Phenylobacterium sp. SCN 70-31 TaxID=1660129 RepID=UPI003426E4AE
MLSLSAERVVHAPIGAVWRAVIDFRGYPRWTGAAVVVEDAAEAGALVYRIRVGTPGRPVRTWSFPGHIQAQEAPRRISWRCGMSALFGVQISFELTPRAGVTEVRHTARITGIVTLLRPVALRRILQPALDRMVRDLEAEARRGRRRGA